jgi:purine-binding chemotaxis protein CheW
MGEAEGLVIRAGTSLCLLPVSLVIETMRPLPVTSASASELPGVLGMAIIRGGPTPVVALDQLLGGGALDPEYRRYVTLRLPGRVIALAVHEVLGLRQLSDAAPLPPLLGPALGERVEAVARLDAELVFLLRAARLVPSA